MNEFVEKDGKIKAVCTEPKKEWIYGDYIKFEGDKPSKEDTQIVNLSLASFLKKADRCGAELWKFNYICNYKDIKTLGWKCVVSKEVNDAAEELLN